MADEKKTILIDIEVDDRDFDKEIGQVNTQLKENREQIKELSKDYAKNATEIAKLEQENKQLSATKRDLIKQNQTENNSLNALRLRLAQLTKERNNLDTSLEGNAQKFSQLQREIKATSDEIKGFEQEGGDFRRNVGNYTASIEEAIGQQQVFGVGIGDLGSKVGLVTAGVGALAAGVLALGQAWASSARGARALERASDRLTSVNVSLGNAIADLIGDTGKVSLLDKALFQLQAATLGLASATKSQAIVALKEQQREFESVSTAIESQKKTLLDAAEAQRQVRDDDRKSIEERIAANERLGKTLLVREEIVSKVLDSQIENIRTQLKFDKDNLVLQEQLNKLLFEREDLREETRGFLSEQLVEENALLKEQRDELLAIKVVELELLKESGAEREELLKKGLEILNQQEQLELDVVGSNEKRKQEVRLRFQLERLRLEKEYAEQIQEVDKETTEKKIDFDAEYRRIQREARKQALAEEKKTNDEIKAQEEALEAFRMNAAGRTLSAISGLLEEGSLAQKRAAQAAVIADSAAAAIGIFKSSTSLPEPAATANRIIQLASLAAATKQSLSAINSSGQGASSIAGGTTTGASRSSSIAGNGLAIVQPQLLSQFSQPVQNQVGLEQASGNVSLPPIYVDVTDINKAQNARQAKVTEGSLV